MIANQLNLELEKDRADEKDLVIKMAENVQ